MINKYIQAIMEIPSGSKSQNRNFGYPNVYDGKMVKNRLRTIKRMAVILDRSIEENDTLPRWCTDLIATSEDRLVMVTDYLLSKMEK
jgi:hypothetical protein